MANTRITDGAFTGLTETAGAVGNIVAFSNGTMAPVEGVVTISRSGLTPSPTFPLKLEPGETVLIRNNTAATTYTFAGSVIHTAVNADIPFVGESRLSDVVEATGQATVPMVASSALVYLEVY